MGINHKASKSIPIRAINPLHGDFGMGMVRQKSILNATKKMGVKIAVTKKEIKAAIKRASIRYEKHKAFNMENNRRGRFGAKLLPFNEETLKLF